jgi:hypothetical protein
MMNRWLIFTVLTGAIILSLPQSQAAPTSQSSCIQCHEFMGGEMAKPVTQWFGSIHQTQEVSCDVCHGGNPDLELGELKRLLPEEIRDLAKRAMYSQPDFVGAPSGQAQLDLCSNCHPEVVQAYAASIMGQAYLSKKGGPSCAQCHGAHRNTIPQVPGSCKRCHQDTTGFDRLKAIHSISEAQVQQLARIRVEIAGQKVAGKGPLFLGHLESFEIGMVTWGMVLLLFLAAVGLYRLLERRNG